MRFLRTVSLSERIGSLPLYPLVFSAASGASIMCDMWKGCATLFAFAASAMGINFRMQEIANGLGIVYAVTVADVNADGKPDIVAINERQLLWFENPTWTKHVILERTTAHDN